MAGYGSFQRSRKGFGSRRGMRRSNSSPGSRYGYKKTGSTVKPRFATVGFSRNVEKKYWDKTYQGNVAEAQTGATGGAAEANGYMYISTNWLNYNFANTTGAAAAISNDMNKGLNTGTTARTRVANKIKPIYYKGAFTFNAAYVDSGLVKDQSGEAIAGLTASNKLSYLRTTYRMVIVKDLQVNSTDPQINWAQVFETNTNLSAGVHSELNVDNMGRFIVLEDKYFTLDGDTPQKTYPFTINGSKIGNVRYNGPSDTALTDKGIYVIYAAYVMGVAPNVTTAMINLPAVVGNTRMCFTDD